MPTITVLLFTAVVLVIEYILVVLVALLNDAITLQYDPSLPLLGGIHALLIVAVTDYIYRRITKKNKV